MKTPLRAGNGVMIGTGVGGFLGVLRDFRMIQQSLNKKDGNMKNTNLSNARIKWRNYTVGSLDFSVSKSKKSVEIRRAIHPEVATDRAINRNRKYLHRLIRKGYSVYQMGLQLHYKGNENPSDYSALVENLPYRR